MASWVKESDKKEVTILNMAVDEFVTKIWGYENGTIERLHFETNKGRSIDAGKHGNGEYFEIDIPEGYCLGKIEGGKNGHLHNLTFHYGIMPAVYTNKRID